MPTILGCYLKELMLSPYSDIKDNTAFILSRARRDREIYLETCDAEVITKFN